MEMLIINKIKAKAPISSSEMLQKVILWLKKEWKAQFMIKVSFNKLFYIVTKKNGILIDIL